jgi:hypothetical protein
MNNCIGAGGCFRAVLDANGGEASIVFDNYTDSRAAAVGDMWVAGSNSWLRSGYTIGTPITNVRSKIDPTGVVNIPIYLATTSTMAGMLRAQVADQITIDDNVIITGNLAVIGTMTASKSKPFWIAGKVSAAGTL